MEYVALSVDRAATVGRLGERFGEPVADLTSDLEQIELPPWTVACIRMSSGVALAYSTLTSE
jgi:hypothetical protein